MGDALTSWGNTKENPGWKKKVPIVAKVKHFLNVLFEERFGNE